MTQPSVRDYERELERDRADIGRTIDAISQKISPGELLGQALDHAKTGGVDAASAVGRSFKQNPWPLLLTGVGLGWLVYATSSSSRREDAGSEPRIAPDHDDSGHVVYDQQIQRAFTAGSAVGRESGEEESAFQSRVTEAKAKALDMTREVGESAEALRDRVEAYLEEAKRKATEVRERASAKLHEGKEAVRRGADSARSQARDLQARTKEFYGAQPLIVGALGLTVGMLAGAMLPASEPEKRALGKFGGRVRERVSDLADTAAEKSKTVMADTAEAALQTAKKGISGDDGSENPPR